MSNSKNITLENLTRYDTNIKEYIAIQDGKTVAGSTAYTLDNAVDYPIVDMRMFGKSTQDGTPTPEAPVEIVSVGNSGAVGVTACGKNLLDRSKFIEGKVIPWQNGIGTATVPGYFVTDFVEVTSGKTYYIQNTTKTGEKWFYASDFTPIEVIDVRISGAFTVPENAKYVRFSGLIENIDKIQLELGDTATSYEPYVGSTTNLTSALPLCGIPVDTDGNYTDSTGQQWICDELVYNADGTGKVVKRTNIVTFDGSDDEGWIIIEPEQKQRLGTYVLKDIMKLPSENNVSADILCNRLMKNTAIKTYQRVQSISVAKTGYISFCISELIGKEISEWKSWLASNPITVVYPFKTPQEIDLTAEEMTALKALQTFNGITNISNDSSAEMRVKYCTNKALSGCVLPIIDSKADKSHTHSKSDITDFPTSLPANGGNADTVNGLTVQTAVPANAKFTDTTYGAASTSANGLMTTGAQTFAGNKTFNGQVIPAGASDVGTAQARKIYAGTDDMTAGTSELETGAIYLVYE